MQSDLPTGSTGALPRKTWQPQMAMASAKGFVSRPSAGPESGSLDDRLYTNDHKEGDIEMAATHGGAKWWCRWMGSGAQDNTRIGVQIPADGVLGPGEPDFLSMEGNKAAPVVQVYRRRRHQPKNAVNPEPAQTTGDGGSGSGLADMPGVNNHVGVVKHAEDKDGMSGSIGTGACQKSGCGGNLHYPAKGQGLTQFDFVVTEGDGEMSELTADDRSVVGGKRGAAQRGPSVTKCGSSSQREQQAGGGVQGGNHDGKDDDNFKTRKPGGAGCVNKGNKHNAHQTVQVGKRRTGWIGQSLCRRRSSSFAAGLEGNNKNCGRALESCQVVEGEEEIGPEKDCLKGRNGASGRCHKQERWSPAVWEKMWDQYVEEKRRFFAEVDAFELVVESPSPVVKKVQKKKKKKNKRLLLPPILQRDNLPTNSLLTLKYAFRARICEILDSEDLSKEDIVSGEAIEGRNGGCTARISRHDGERVQKPVPEHVEVIMETEKGDRKDDLVAEMGLLRLEASEMQDPQTGDKGHADLEGQLPEVVEGEEDGEWGEGGVEWEAKGGVYVSVGAEEATPVGMKLCAKQEERVREDAAGFEQMKENETLVEALECLPTGDTGSLSLLLNDGQNLCDLGYQLRGGEGIAQAGKGQGVTSGDGTITAELSGSGDQCNRMAPVCSTGAQNCISCQLYTKGRKDVCVNISADDLRPLRESLQDRSSECLHGYPCSDSCGVAPTAPSPDSCMEDFCVSLSGVVDGRLSVTGELCDKLGLGEESNVECSSHLQHEEQETAAQNKGDRADRLIEMADERGLRESGMHTADAKHSEREQGETAKKEIQDHSVTEEEGISYANTYPVAPMVLARDNGEMRAEDAVEREEQIDIGGCMGERMVEVIGRTTAGRRAITEDRDSSAQMNTISGDDVDLEKVNFAEHLDKEDEEGVVRQLQDVFASLAVEERGKAEEVDVHELGNSAAGKQDEVTIDQNVEHSVMDSTSPPMLNVRKTSLLPSTAATAKPQGEEGISPDGNDDDLSGVASCRRASQCRIGDALPSTFDGLFMDDSVSSLSLSLQVLLGECRQRKLVCLMDAVKEFAGDNAVRKIGEGTYGEAFATNGLVFKVVPIGGDFCVNGEPQKSEEEAFSEVMLSNSISSLRGDWKHGNQSESFAPNFIKTLGVRVCKGAYDPTLTTAWEDWDSEHGSENDHPMIFPDSQLYIVFVLADGGKDLEGFVLQSFAEAKSLLLQVTLCLAVGEEACGFEHRDLHWGNVLLSRQAEGVLDYRLQGRNIKVRSAGVLVSLIDFTLSRLEVKGGVLFFDLSRDTELFEGPRRNTQSNTYRWMGDVTKGDWEGRYPQTNGLWIHYLADTLVYQKSFPCLAHEKAALVAFCKRARKSSSAVSLVNDSFFADLWIEGYQGAPVRTPLAIKDSPHEGWRNGQMDDCIDALPYIDQEYGDQKWKDDVSKLIEEEMRRSRKTPADFLAELPPLPNLNFENCPLLAKEFERVQAGKPFGASIDLSRYSLEPPGPNEWNDVLAWKKALANARAQLGQMHLRIMNLELALKYAPNSWRALNQYLEAMNSRFTNVMTELQKEIEVVNRERKLNQMAAASELNRLTTQWKELAEKNIEIETACASLEAEVQRLREEAERRGIDLNPSQLTPR
ncbi:hypothetical protein CBR_g46893 [Chara braunii]|uniref:non-specific serine/threonine protein kinase n=1 Tax=Chara braunii TaxID=69332 RepID=A0A388M1A6_CHABU|nr:hypothetical protein CBR_g46893 [Chara braunii]|eukprot:GBG88326.1 hypothetical protein CBR_g46893 [Chara braunii]